MHLRADVRHDLARQRVGAEDFAGKVGDALAEAFRRNISSAVLPNGKMYWNIADRAVRPMLEEDHRLVADAAAEVQQALNEAAGIGIKAQRAPLNQDRVDGILNKISAADQYDDVADVLDEPVKNFSRSVVDDTVKSNVDFQGRAGLAPKIIRRAEGHCCEWCSRIAGTYTYPDVPDDIYRRHDHCRCTVEYDPGTGKRQNVHTKQWTEPGESAKILERQLIGLRSNGVIIQKVSDHVMEKMTERSVLVDSVHDAIERPLKVNPVKYDEAGRPSFTIIGRKATIAVNPDTGVISTCYPTHTKTREKLLEALKKK